MKRKEGVYLIKVVDKLPKKGNLNYLYTIKGKEFKELFEYSSTGSYNTITVGSSGGSSILASGVANATPGNTVGDTFNIPHGLATTPNIAQVSIILGTAEPHILALTSVDSTNIVVENFDGWGASTDIIWKVTQ